MEITQIIEASLKKPENQMTLRISLPMVVAMTRTQHLVSATVITAVLMILELTPTKTMEAKE